MSKNKLLLLSIPTSAIVAVLVYLLMGQGSSYLNALPQDVVAVARLNVADFVDGLDFNEAERKQLLVRCAQVDDVSELGLDLRRPIYGFASQKGDFGVVAAVADDDALSRLCKNYSEKGQVSEIVRQRGYNWTVVKGQWLLAFDSKKALMMGPAVGDAQDQLRSEMVRLLSQDSDESGEGKPLFKRLKSGEALTAVMSPEPELLPSPVRSLLGYFGVHSAADALLSLSLEFDDEELEVKADVLAESDETKDVLREMESALRPLKGQLARYASATPPIWLTANVQGRVLLDKLRQTSARGLLVAFNLVVDADRIVESFDGDLAVELSQIPSSLDLSALSNVSLTAKVASTDFLSKSSSWGNAWIDVEKLSDKAFRLNWETAPLYFGVEDDVFYLGAHPLAAGSSNAHLADEADDIAGKRFFATAEVPALLSPLGPKKNLLPSVVCRLEHLDVAMEKPGEFSLRVTAPKGTNLAKEIFLAP